MNKLSENITANLKRHGGSFKVASHREKAIADFGSDAAFAAFNRSGNSGLPSADYIKRHREEVARMVAAGQLDLDEKFTPSGAYWMFSAE